MGERKISRGDRWDRGGQGGTGGQGDRRASQEVVLTRELGIRTRKLGMPTREYVTAAAHVGVLKRHDDVLGREGGVPRGHHG